MNKNYIILAIVSVACVTFLMFGVFIWPTPYKCELRPVGVIRINRFTGNAVTVPIDVPSSKPARRVQSVAAPAYHLGHDHGPRAATREEMRKWPGVATPGFPK